MNRIVIWALAVLVSTSCTTAVHDVSVSKIWDEGYSAFPSIERFNGKYYVSFREGVRHVFDENGIAAGKTRILVSDDGNEWSSVALLSKEGYDLRDPKLSVMPDGRLMVIMGGSVYVDRVRVSCTPHVSFSSDGKNFTDPVPVVFDGDIDGDEWIWRVTWHDGVGYGVTYVDHFALLRTLDGIHYETIKELDIPAEYEPGESTVRFAPDGRMLMMTRCEKNGRLGRWGISEAPYTDWEWKTMDFHLGGPDFMVQEDGTVLAGSRFEFPGNICKTMLFRGDVGGNFEEIYLLPSGGDTSYPGFIDTGDEIWMVYYSCHESKRASIYLARFRKDFLDNLAIPARGE